MTTFVLEMRSTANWQDIRYREYTSSVKKAELFKGVPRIDFTDSGHGIVPHVREHRGRREPRNMLLADHVQEYITAKGREVKRPDKLREENAKLRAALTKALREGEDRQCFTYSLLLEIDAALAISSTDVGGDQ